MASWAQGNLVRAKNAMDAMNMGTEARLKGGAALGNSLQQLLGMGFQNWQGGLQRKHERGQLNTQIQGEKDLQKLLAMIEAQGAGGLDMTPETVPPSPRPGQTTTETEQMPLEERYTPAQQQIKDMMLKSGWKTKAQFDTSDYQTALKTAKEMYGPTWDGMSAIEKTNIITQLMRGWHYGDTNGNKNKEDWGGQEALSWVIMNMRDYAANSEKGRAYSTYDQESQSYIPSGTKEGTVKVFLKELYDRSRLVPQLVKLFPTEEAFNQQITPLLENQIYNAGKAGGGQPDFRSMLPYKESGLDFSQSGLNRKMEEKMYGKTGNELNTAKLQSLYSYLDKNSFKMTDQEKRRYKELRQKLSKYNDWATITRPEYTELAQLQVDVQNRKYITEEDYGKQGQYQKEHMQDYMKRLK
jgi:hypothetical protein